MTTPDPNQAFKTATKQQQFLNVIDRDEADRRFQSHLDFSRVCNEEVPLDQLSNRILAEDIRATIDVPGFDRSNVDGFAVIADDIVGAMEETPVQLRINHESLLPGVRPQHIVTSGTATPISTGGMVPRGATAVVMIEETHVLEDSDPLCIEVTRSVAPGNLISYAGSDIAQGETVLWNGSRLTSREIGVLASLGRASATVYGRPRVAIVSTGDEVIAPGDPLPVGCIYDSNSAILAAAVQECGCEPVFLGRVQDDIGQLQSMMDHALQCDAVLLSGGTSKGAGDLSYHVVKQFSDPGIVAHGVALKPGKPICLAVTQGKPVVILPGFPTSAIFTFHEFVAPVLRRLAKQPQQRTRSVSARLPMQLNSSRGRTEFVLARLFESETGLIAYPMGKGSGSVTTYSLADGFLTIPANVEIVDAGSRVDVKLIDDEVKPRDLVIIGSHCAGLDAIVGHIQRKSGCSISLHHVGSEAGATAVRRGECDLAGVHLVDPRTDQYNLHLTNDDCLLIRGYRRMQCFVSRADDVRFQGCPGNEAVRIAATDASCSMVNRNPGSGTRILIDQLLSQMGTSRPHPAGYGMQVKSHNAVAAAISQGRADWGIAIESVARAYGLRTIPIVEEQYDFLLNRRRLGLPGVKAFLNALQDADLHAVLCSLGYGFETESIGAMVDTSAKS